MTNYYSKLKKGGGTRLLLPRRLKLYSQIKLAVLFFAVCFSVNSNAQLLINPAAEGGFENGPTFADNGWTVVNAATNKWSTSTVPGWFTGTNGAHITNNTTTNAWEYSRGSTSSSHFYRDVAFPAGMTAATLTFDWRGNGNDTNYDNLLVYVANTNITPTTSGPTGTSTNNTSWTGYNNGTTGYFLLQRSGTAAPTATTGVTHTFTAAQLTYLAGNTRRLIFVWKNDESGGSNPPASLDNISLSVVVPSCIQPTAVTGAQASATSANLSWTASASAPASGYEWEVRTTGAGGSGATGLATSGTTLAGVTTAVTSGLTANTSYRLYVRSSCGSGDFSTWASSSAFVTPLSCFVPTALTGTQTSATSANLSWTAPTTAPSSGYEWEVRTTGAGGSGATGLATSGSTLAGVTAAVTSGLMPNTSYRLYVRSSCGSDDFSTWGGSSAFTTPVSCFEPTALTATIVSASSVNFAWTASASTPGSGYEWEFRTTGAPASGATGLRDSGVTAAGVVTAATSTLTTSNNSYVLYVRSNCGAGDFSTWSSVGFVTNDDCSGAYNLVVGTQLTTSNFGATKSLGTEPTCEAYGFSTSGKDVWYSIVVPAGVVRMDIETNNNSDTNLTDTGMEAYRGTCGALVSIECDTDDSPDGNFSLLNLTALTPGETLYVRAWGYNGSSGTFKIKASVPACGTETRWNGTAWSNNIPVENIVAIIEGDYSGPGFTACSLRVTGTSQVVFTSGSNLTLNGLLNVASTASMTLESNANLIQTVNGSNTGNITVKRESAQLVRLNHTLWSSPVAAQKLFAFSPNTLTNRFYTFATATNNYVNTGLSATTDFTVGKGYGVRAPNNHPTTPATWIGSFTGNPNNGNKSFALVTTGQGFNLVGNPYPSVIDGAAFVAANTTRINGTLYFYAHTLTMSEEGTFSAGTNYALWNGTGGTAATVGTSGVPALVPNGKIQVGQGFFVKSTNSGNLVFNNSMREASYGNQFFRTAPSVQTTSEAEKHRLWLNLTNAEGTTFNQILVGYVAGATQEFDNLYDGLSFGNEGSALSSRLSNEDYTIQGRALPFNAADVVPLGFKAVTSGNYTISLSDSDGVFAADQDVFLKDNANGSINNIKTAPYAFTAEAGTFNNRFEVVYQSTLGTPELTFDSSSVVAYIKEAQLNIQTKGNSMKTVSVYDVRGRLLFSKSDINAADFVAQGLASQNQVLLVQVTAENGEVATVKVIF